MPGAQRRVSRGNIEPCSLLTLGQLGLLPPHKPALGLRKKVYPLGTPYLHNICLRQPSSRHPHPSSAALKLVTPPLQPAQEEFEAGVTAMKAVSEREKHAKETGEAPAEGEGEEEEDKVGRLRGCNRGAGMGVEEGRRGMRDGFGARRLCQASPPALLPPRALLRHAALHG